MMRASFMPLALLATGCGDGVSDNKVAAVNHVEAVRSPPAPAPKPSSGLASECPLPPTLALSDSFGAAGKLFSPDSSPFRQTKAAFEAAYSRACASGILRETPLIPLGAARPSALLLKNAPDANVASIYRDGDGDRPMVLEYPFITGEGAIRVPTGEELGEAIFCAVHGASDQEQEESGRCLVD
jgi:hypothetical protein